MKQNAAPARHSDDPVLCLENLTKRYGNFTALNDLTLSVNAGQILGLIGPNGAGKTTIIKILVGLIRPTSGKATIAGVDCARESQQTRRLVGYMPDKFGAYENMRVREYLDFFGATFDIPRSERTRRIDHVMELTNTTVMKDKYVESLSHGMQQRVGLARTLVHDPKVLILDEPVNGLDPQARIEMRDLLIELAGQGKTLLVTSHILPELARICDQVAIMTNGTLRAKGSVDEIGRQVSQRRTIECQLASDEHLSAAGRVIRDSIEPGADVVEAQAEATVRFRTALPESELSDVLTSLVQAGVRVTQFREVQTDLEEAFMSFARPQADTAQQQPAPVAGARAHA